MDKSVNLLTAAWYGDNILTLNFPEDWDIHIVEQNNYPALTDDEIRKQIINPLGSALLSELARGKRYVAILVDDIQRPTPLRKVIPCVLDELDNGGIKKEQIIIVMAVACHRTATKEDFVKKLGVGTVEHVKIVSHDCKNNLLYLGKTKRGTPVYVNKLVTECDLKVGISGIYPHEQAGFGGGAKIIHPGVCGVKTAKHLHGNITGSLRGGSIDNEFRADIEEIAEKVGLDFSINLLLNQNREISHIFSGDSVRAHAEGVMAAHQLYGVQPIDDADIVISNVYPFDTSLHFISKGLWPLHYIRRNGTKIVVSSCSEGLGYHALSLRSLPGWSGFFSRMRALSYSDIKHFFCRIRKREAEFLFFSPTVKKSMLKKMYPTAKLYNTWEGLIQDLKDRHEKLPVKVAVYSCSPLQIPVD